MTTFLYIIIIVFVSVLIGLAQTYGQDKKKVKRGVILLAGALTINIIYTKLLGWHSIGTSTLEWTLDILDSIPIWIGSRLLSKEIELAFRKKKIRKLKGRV